LYSSKRPLNWKNKIASCLRVAEVAQARITAAESSVQIAYLSVNDRVELDIKYADELGYTFHEAHGVAPVKIETNYPDVVSILMPRDLNGTHGTHERFVLQARSHGTALIRLHVNHIPNKVDFIMVKFFVINHCQFMLCLIHYSLQLLKLEDGMGFLIPASYIIMYC